MDLVFIIPTEGEHMYKDVGPQISTYSSVEF
jgi:hypothetical protein